MSPGTLAMIALGVLWPALPVSAEDVRYGAEARVRTREASAASDIDVASAAARPGAFGEPARALLDLAGVARSGFFGTELSVWGATPGEARIYVDGAELPWLLHTGGLRAAVHPALVDTLRLTPAAPRADFGRGTGPVIELGLVRDVARGVHGRASVDAIDGSLAVRASNDRVSFVGAVRKGYFDRLVSTVAPEASAVVRIPSHADGGARLVYRPRAHETWALTWLGADERSALRQTDRRESLDRQTQSLLLAYTRSYADGASVSVTPFAGLDLLRDTRTYGGVPLALREHGQRAGLRAVYALPGRVVGLRVGLDAQLTQARVARTGTFTLPAREGDVFLFGQAPVAAVGDERFRAGIVNLAPHLTVPVRFHDLRVEPGLRIDAYAISASRGLPEDARVPALGRDHFYAFVDPRVHLEWRALPRVVPYLDAGIRHAPPLARELGPAFGNPRLRPSRVREAVLGARASWADTRCDAALFVRRFDELAVRSARTPPALSEALRATGDGRAYGLQTVLAFEPTWGVFAHVAYTLSRSVRTDADGSWRRVDFDQTHVFSTLVGHAFAQTRVSARVRYATGVPRTRVLSHYLDTVSGDEQPLFGRHNGARNPNFVQLDLHADQRVSFGSHTLSVSLDIINVTARENVELVAYGASFETRRDVRGLPGLVYAGLGWEF